MIFKHVPLFTAAIASAALLLGCANGTVTNPTDDDGSGGSTTSASGGGGSGGGGSGGSASGGSGSGGFGLCGQDCSEIPTPVCFVAVCNEGQHSGPIGSCVVVNDENGTSCDDGQFCTVNDSCTDGVCGSEEMNDCGNDDVECQEITCNEDTDSCGTQPADNGSLCTPTNLCETNGTCTNGLCNGQPIDCFFAPVPPCEVAVCDPMDGMCKGEYDALQEGTQCVDPMDLCTVGKSCNTGLCVGGAAKDCSNLDIGCQNGACNVANGACEGVAVPQGGACNDGVGPCETGTCDAAQTCVLAPVVDGTVCNDFNTCTNADQCTSGTCGGTQVSMCTVYFEETFEVCPPPGWTLASPWECGVPANVGPAAASVPQGINILGVDLDADYADSLTYALTFAQTPPISIPLNIPVVLSYQHYVDTEGSIYDGYNIKVSTDGGATWAVLQTVDPVYPLTIDGESAYGGHVSTWELVTANLTAFAGQQILLRFSFRSDTIIQYPGVYLDDMKVSDADAVPVNIINTSLPNVLTGDAYNETFTASGGTGMAVWSIAAGGTNDGWLSIDPMTGVLTGAPVAANLGAVSVTIRYEEPTNPTNFDEVTYSFNVQAIVYTDDIEATCPGNWALAGEWQCGAPTSGPNAAFSGTQVIGTVLAGMYSNNQSWALNTASSPINLTTTTAPSLRFNVWYDTEGSSFDGWNIKVSTDGGVTYTQVLNVSPVHPLNIDGQACWGGHNDMLWQEYTADLSAYAGMQIDLQFAMRTDGSVMYAGVYIDDVKIAD